MKWNKKDPEAKRIWVWAVLDRATQMIVDWVIGDRGVKTFKPLYDRIVDEGCRYFCTDQFPVYKTVVKVGHSVSKEFTTHIESFWSDTRLFIKGLNRKTKCCFKSLETLWCMFKFYIYNYNMKKLNKLT